MADNEAFRFAELLQLREQAGEIPVLKPFTARDSTRLAYRYYPSHSRTHLILLHGSSGHSAHLHAFAKYLSYRNAASAAVPDLRGHGPSPQRRGDIDYIDQLEDDLADLIEHLRASHSVDRVVVGGFSSGGGLALRFAGGRHAVLAQGALLLAPYLGYGTPMIKRHAPNTRWARADIPRILGLMALNACGVTLLNGATVLRFNLPKQYRSNDDTLSYSFRLMKGMHPDDYRESLRNMREPMLILTGSGDEALRADSFSAAVLPYKPDTRVHIVKSSHLGLIVNETAMAKAAQWIEELGLPQR